MQIGTVSSDTSRFVGIFEASVTSMMNLFGRAGSVVTRLTSERVREEHRLAKRERERIAVSVDSCIAPMGVCVKPTGSLYTVLRATNTHGAISTILSHCNIEKRHDAIWTQGYRNMWLSVQRGTHFSLASHVRVGAIAALVEWPLMSMSTQNVKLSIQNASL